MGKAIELSSRNPLLEPKGCVTTNDDVEVVKTAPATKSQAAADEVAPASPVSPTPTPTTTTALTTRKAPTSTGIIRKVQFNETENSIQRFEKEYDDCDYNQIWYSMEELNEIQTTNSKMIRKESRKFVSPLADKKSRRRFCDTDDWSWRGFEYASTRYGMVKVRNDHVKTVLKCQKQQKSPKALADQARMKTCSSGCNLRARSNAIRDELVASKIHKEFEDMKKPLAQDQQQKEKQPTPQQRQGRLRLKKKSNYRRSRTF